MFCQYCGSKLDQGARFCRSCGKETISHAPQIVAADPLQGLSSHLRILGILWLVYSVFHIAMSAWTLFFARYFLPAIETAFQRTANPIPFPIFHIMRLIYALSLFYAVATGILGVIAGYGLLQRKSWGRIVALVAAFISVISIPFGTAIAIYTLLVLLAGHADREYGQLAATA